MYTVTLPATRNEFRAMIEKAEQFYKDQLTETAEKLISVSGLQIVTLTGPSCSGKTTTAEKLCALLEKSGHPVYTVSIDDFYIDRNVLPRTALGRIDYDSAATLDLSYLAQCLDGLVRETETRLPVYDFAKGMRAGYTTYCPRENDIILLEGIQTMYPEIRAHLPKDVTRSIAIAPQEDICAVGADGKTVCFTAREIRLLRRLVRDARTRSTNAEGTLSMWEDVCANEDQNIFPYLCDADITMDSFLSYELSVICAPAECLLRALPLNSAYSDIADALLKRLSVIIPMPVSDVPTDSVFREFIGA